VVQAATDVGNREKLLRAAVECLREKGYANTTARDLVAASGTNLASIGYHFGGKEALMNEAVAETTRAWMRSIEAEVWKDGTEHPAEHLRRMFAATLDRFEQLEPYLRSFVEAFPPALRSDDLRGSMARAYEEVRTGGEAMLERIFEGADPPVAPEHRRALSSVLLALCDGLILQWLLDRDAAPDDAGIDGVNGRYDDRPQRRLRGLLHLGGIVATCAGLHTLLVGGRSFPPWRAASAMVESELRFYSAFYVAYGLLAFRTARHASPDPPAVRALAAALFLAGLGRAGAWLTVGKPHPLQQALLAIEVVGPPLVVVEQARLRSPADEARR
jgi:AcrR family transcriptional regulator